MKSFPKPLDVKEEEEMLRRCKAGDREARNSLIEHNLRLVAHIVKKYGTADKEADDLISIGTIGLIKAVDTFDDEKGIRLATYASRCIDNELLMLFRSEKKLGRDVSLYEPIGSDKEGNELSLLDVMESHDEDITESMELQENTINLYHFIYDVLNEREREIICLRYGLFGEKEVTQRELADKLGISRSYCAVKSGQIKESDTQRIAIRNMEAKDERNQTGIFNRRKSAFSRKKSSYF